MFSLILMITCIVVGCIEVFYEENIIVGYALLFLSGIFFRNAVTYLSTIM